MTQFRFVFPQSPVLISMILVSNFPNLFIAFFVFQFKDILKIA